VEPAAGPVAEEQDVRIPKKSEFRNFKLKSSQDFNDLTYEVMIQ